MESSTSAGYAYSHEWSSDLVFAGSLAGMPADRYAENAYGAGLVAYQTNVVADDGSEQSFIVVSYFVE